MPYLLLGVGEFAPNPKPCSPKQAPTKPHHLPACLPACLPPRLPARRADWKACSASKEEEEARTERFKEEFKAFDIMQ